MTPSGKALADRAQREAWGAWEGIRQLDIPAIEAEASRATLDAIGPWLHHAMTCASTEGYGVVDGVRLTPQKPCDCGLDAVIQKQRDGGAP